MWHELREYVEEIYLDYHLDNSLRLSTKLMLPSCLKINSDLYPIKLNYLDPATEAVMKKRNRQDISHLRSGI
jgi:hypothetical protein